MSFNLNSLALRDTTELKLRHPVTQEVLADDQGNEVIVHLYGPSSKQYRQTVRAMQERALKRNGKKATPAQLEEESINLLVAISDRIDNLEYKGKPVDNEAAFRELYSDPSMLWLKDQVEATLGDVSAFLGQ
jgi:hypothetical protein